MKNKIFIVLFFCSIAACSQVSLEGRVKDLKSKEPIAYCAVGLKNGTKGCLTNDEGVFTISPVLQTDSLVISFVGYKRKTITVSDLAKNSTIYLENKDNVFAEIVVYGSNDYLYNAFEKCRKQLFNQKENTSKVYFILESEIGKQPVELLECYYNGRFDNCTVTDLSFKNGRVGLAPYEERYYSNYNTSKAFTFLDLLNKNEYLPAVPLQFNKRNLKKAYQLKLKYRIDSINPVYDIEFIPRNNNGNYFSGEIWIDINTGNLKKIDLVIYKTKCHPFVPLDKESGTIENVSMQISKTFETKKDGINLLHHINFNYQVNYHHAHLASLISKNTDTTFEAKSKGLMYFYDYNDLFFIPEFGFNQDLSDYRKIASLSYNDAFWHANSSLIYSDKMKKGIRYFKENGYFLNYASGMNNKTKSNKNTRHKFYENSLITWNEKARLSLKKNGMKNDTVSNTGFTVAQRYHLKARIFFDVNPIGDSLQHYSVSIFDIFETYYNLREEPFTNCFINIYFDLVEIERRKMEKVISKNKFTMHQLDSLYKSTVKDLEKQTADYMKQVEHGKNLKELEKWNDYIKQNLNINNIEIFELREQK